MEKKILTSPQTGDKCIYVKHSSGLDIYIYVKWKVSAVLRHFSALNTVL